MDILFASGQATLTEQGHASLREVGAGLATIPEPIVQDLGRLPQETDLFAVIQQFGRDEGFTVIVESSLVAYAHESVDVTTGL